MPSYSIDEYLSTREIVNYESFSRLFSLSKPEGRSILESKGYARKEGFYYELETNKKEIENYGNVPTKNFIITSYTLGSYVNQDFLKNLKTYADYIDARLVVIPMRYNNKAKIEDNVESDANSFVSPDIIDYLEDNRFDLTDNLTIFADIKINPTAYDPITGLIPLTRNKTGVFAHTTIRLKTIPTAIDTKSGLIVTTGSISDPLYADSLAAKKAEYHHQLGCVVINLKDDGSFNMRSINARKSNGSFKDLGIKVKNGKVTEAIAKIAVFGDTHLGQEDGTVLRKALKVCNKLEIEEIVLHDLFDGMSINPHSKLMDRHAIKMSLEEELNYNADWLTDITDQGYKITIVNSNHNQFIGRWVEANDPRCMGKRDLSWYAYFLTVAEESNYVHPDYYSAAMKRLMNSENYKKVKFLAVGEVYRRFGYNLSNHGHKGVNGAKFSPKGSASIGEKLIVGHSHSAEIMHGVIVTGCTCKLAQSYNSEGFSSWVHAMTTIYEDGQSQLITF
jgi:hypothetical protein